MNEDVLFKAGDVVFDSESSSDIAYFIMQGSISLTLQLGIKEITIHVGENQFVGDAAAVVTQKNNIDKLHYHGRAIALEDVRAVAIPIKDIKQELENCPPLLKAWISSFISRVLVVVDELANT